MNCGGKRTGDRGGGNSGIGRMARVPGRLHRILTDEGDSRFLAPARIAGGGREYMENPDAAQWEGGKVLYSDFGGKAIPRGGNLL